MPVACAAATTDVRLGPRDRPCPCPCCGFLPLAEHGAYEICQVCFCEDDADTVRVAPSNQLSLTAARRNFTGFGVVDRRWLQHVRDPRPEEYPSRASAPNQRPPDKTSSTS
ncbi:CPCC family cysteine-rich protein [Actinomadura oligospora]|uniref:CPCC family cysteine-rich protein n=1 Tax=Actinomadura oligospora TaxID=111804 RepID=UPI000A0504A8